MFILGIIMIVASAVCSVASVRLTSRANPGVHIPLWSNPPSRSRAGTVLTVSTLVLMIWGGNLATEQLGSFVFLILIAVVVGPYLVVRLFHNRTVARLDAVSRP
ncbi:hypothetical protein [Cryobacterium psychrophilum]|uniref:Uncharacterized protein n=1 Tax=Cryobacterium psychrophilum TaxID=41988 RepID=A0A4Y8KM34_9MICO|nr:hypothetical protein [Cryobacterium psychrophilum]TDW30629.1 hypothetical protein EDD25_2396 [Cryobacterium psychrophilum]TFD77050.1 hypothetical protein E3T53_12325 [Cryobacterium psychrophilum]